MCVCVNVCEWERKSVCMCARVSYCRTRCSGKVIGDEDVVKLLTD